MPKSTAFPRAEEDANGDPKESAKKHSLEPAAEFRKPKSPPPTVAKKQKPGSADASRPKDAAPANGAAPPATLPKPSVSAGFLLQARRPRAPAVGEDGDDEAGDGVKGMGTIFVYVWLGEGLWDSSLSNNLS